MQFRTTALASALLLLGIGSMGAQAASENLLIDNSTLATAQAVGPLSFEGVINVFGVRGTVAQFGTLIVDNNDADYYAFTITGPRSITLRVDTSDGPGQGDDSNVGLFSSDGVAIAVNDDGGPGYDSVLTFPVMLSGTYYAAVSGFDDFDFDGLSDFFEDEGVGNPFGDTNWPYLLQIMARPVAVPLPAAVWLLSAGLLGLAARRRGKA